MQILLKNGEWLLGDLHVPHFPEGLVVFAHGSGSSRKSPRNQWIAKKLQNNNYATLLIDLLTEKEEAQTQNVFDIDLLSGRLMEVALWVKSQEELKRLPIALFGASTGAGAALQAAAQWSGAFQAIVSRGGRPDLAKDFLSQVRPPTLLIVGGRDELVLRLNRLAFEKLRCKKKLSVVSGATHLFEEPGALEKVLEETLSWLDENLKAPRLPFHDRKSAALQLVKRMKGRVFHRPLVLAIPRGGVVTGSVLAEGLEAELDGVIARKLRHPRNQELAMGAICESDEPYLTEEGERVKRESPDPFQAELKKQKKEIQDRRRKLGRAPEEILNVKGRSVILTDDGIATGSTILAACTYLRGLKPQELIVAVPVAPYESIEALREVCDEVVCLATPEPFFAVAQFYKEFPEVGEGEGIHTFHEIRKSGFGGRGAD